MYLNKISWDKKVIILFARDLGSKLDIIFVNSLVSYNARLYGNCEFRVADFTAEQIIGGE